MSRCVRYLCDHCNSMFDEDEIAVEYHPPTWGYDGGSPAEYIDRCPNCGEELCEEDIVADCEICGEPMVRELPKGYSRLSTKYCDECNSIIDRCFKEMFDDMADELGVTVDRAISIAFERAEERAFYEDEKKS